MPGPSLVASCFLKPNLLPADRPSQLWQSACSLSSSCLADPGQLGPTNDGVQKLFLHSPNVSVHGETLSPIVIPHIETLLKRAPPSR